MKTLKRLLCLGIFLFITACASTNYWHTIGTNGTMLEHTTEVYNDQASLDSICEVEKLPSIDKWKKLQTRNYETGNTYTQYVYVTQTDSTEMVYTITVINNDNEYNFVKRSVK